MIFFPFIYYTAGDTYTKQIYWEKRCIKAKLGIFLLVLQLGTSLLFLMLEKGRRSVRRDLDCYLFKGCLLSRHVFSKNDTHSHMQAAKYNHRSLPLAAEQLSGAVGVQKPC